MRASIQTNIQTNMTRAQVVEEMIDTSPKGSKRALEKAES
jgi:hypothetical protein